MSGRIAFESWQLLFPVIGIGIFAAVFFGIVFRVWRMKPPAVGHMEALPLEGEHTTSPGAGLGEAGPGSPTPATVPQPVSAVTHVR